jgi:hypothetical protein
VAVDHRPVRAAIVGLLGTVTGMGQVHSYERYVHVKSDLAAVYLSGGQLNGWFVRRVGYRRTREPGQIVTNTHWRIGGYLGLADADQTELQMDDLVDGINAAIEADRTLGGAVNDTGDGRQIGAILDDSGPVLFAGVLCHSVRLTLITRQIEFCATS